MKFSEHLDALRDYASGAAQVAAKKSRQVATITKAKLDILAEEDKIKKAQTELGKVYYKDFVLEEEPDEAEYLPWCDQITESLKLIENLKAEIELAKEDDIVCDAEVVEEAKEEPVAEAATEAVEEAIEAAEEAPAEES